MAARTTRSQTAQAATSTKDFFRGFWDGGHPAQSNEIFFLAMSSRLCNRPGRWKWKIGSERLGVGKIDPPTEKLHHQRLLFKGLDRGVISTRDVLFDEKTLFDGILPDRLLNPEVERILNRIQLPQSEIDNATTLMEEEYVIEQRDEEENEEIEGPEATSDHEEDGSSRTWKWSKSWKRWDFSPFNTSPHIASDTSAWKQESFLSCYRSSIRNCFYRKIFEPQQALNMTQAKYGCSNATVSVLHHFAVHTYRTRSGRPRKVSSDVMHQMLNDNQNLMRHRLRILNYLLDEYETVGTKYSAVNS